MVNFPPVYDAILRKGLLPSCMIYKVINIGDMLYFNDLFLFLFLKILRMVIQEKIMPGLA
jgi:hypothetical protein